eukprot:scaffold584_cov132-Cylindrotheca_fusiformis.AAC.4
MNQSLTIVILAFAALLERVEEDVLIPERLFVLLPRESSLDGATETKGREVFEREIEWMPNNFWEHCLSL